MGHLNWVNYTKLQAPQGLWQHLIEVVLGVERHLSSLPQMSAPGLVGVS